ncbi:hypothetical protein K502DRAFT_353755 [Neoconidiobolus thromboides FSU 785]|nr:hypothetical protein K502DRAFT_353755 [Neoconidiobolus thromboides FSU 785]
MIAYIVIGGFCLLLFALLPYIYKRYHVASDDDSNKISARTEVGNRSISMDRNAQLGENNVSIDPTSAILENISITKGHKFSVGTEEQHKISEKKYHVFFNNDCIMQAKYQKLNPESLYYEIKLVDFTGNFELLFGYADKSTSEIHESHILLNNKIYGVNVNQKQYPNTFVHTLKKGDIIGCFYDLVSNEVTFTYNGNDLCYYQFQANTMYPTIYSTKGTLIKYNVGNQPFLYRRANQLKLGLTSNYVQDIPPSY